MADPKQRAESSAPTTTANATNGTSTTIPNTSNAPRFNQNPDRTSNNTGTTAPKTGVVQPKPQGLPKRHGPASIIVSPRQKGNPVLAAIKSMPWEYGDIPADYVLGLTTCALFLSLKYHRLHPEYIYTRIKALQGKYALRVVLCMVDITNHEPSLKELSKTSLINNVTLILCWSSAEGARYLELFKTYENAAPTSIRQHQSTKYADRMVDFITTPRSINKTDAVSLVSQFGSIRTAVNARHEDVAGIAGWGEKKVRKWTGVVREPFRTVKAGRRGISREVTRESAGVGLSREGTRDGSSEPGGLGRSPPPSRTTPLGGSRPATATATGTADADRRPTTRLAEEVDMNDSLFVGEDEEPVLQSLIAKPIPPEHSTAEGLVPQKRKPPADDDPLSDGVMAALSRLRKS